MNPSPLKFSRGIWDVTMIPATATDSPSNHRGAGNIPSPKGSHIYAKIFIVSSRAHRPLSSATRSSGGNDGPDDQDPIFAGGCFWCMQPEFDRTEGVVKTTVGYTGGKKSEATYEMVSSHRTQHREAIEVTYDPAKVSYDKLLEIYWSNIDPTQKDGQFADIGLSYQAAIYYGNEEEQKAAEHSKEELGKSGQFDQPIVTQILPAMPFYPAEEYHQKYYLKNADAFEAYHVGSGRTSFQKRNEAKKKKLEAAAASSPMPTP